MRLESIKQKKKGLGLKDSIKALRYIPRFFGEIKTSGRGLFYTNLLTRLAGSLSPVIILWVGKLIIDEIIQITKTPEPDLHQLWIYVAIEFGVVIGSDLIGRLSNLTVGLLGDLYSNDSSVKIIKKTKELTISDLEDSSFYDKLERARTQTANRVNLLNLSLSQVQSLIGIVSLVAALIYFEPLLIILLMISIIPSFINEMRYSSQQYSLAKSWTAERRELDYLRYIGANDKTAKEMKLFGLIDFVADRFKSLSDEYYGINKKLIVERSAYGALFNVLGVLSYYGAYVLIIYRVVTGIITVGELTFLSGAFNRLRSNLETVFGQFTRLAESSLYLKDYFDYLDFHIGDAPFVGTPVPTEIKTGFIFNNVSFTYPGSEVQVLKGVSFELKRGEKLAFVGENGAGKTTLIKLLLRFYKPDGGEILLDGININSFEKETYQEMFGVIFQDFVRYEFTVGENIAVGNIDEIENEELIDRAAELSLAKEVVSELKMGYEQQLGKRFSQGKDLSGGQWQKVALARAYMKEAQVMVLDEPTSALDARAEYEAFQRFIGLTEGRTSIIISHRFSTVRMADRIIVLKDGKILELGTHDELMRAPNLYAELFQLQAAGYQ